MLSRVVRRGGKSLLGGKKKGGFFRGKNRPSEICYQRKWANARLAWAILCMSSRFLIALP